TFLAVFVLVYYTRTKYDLFHYIFSLNRAVLTPIRIGKYQLTDSEFSGTYFATMRANVVVESSEDYKKWLHQAANRKPCTANNQAASEYAQESKELIKGWVTVAPAQAPVVNYSN
ncbi:MAG: hypothetical protein V7L28_19115, partial [Nostoc sp.]